MNNLTVLHTGPFGVNTWIIPIIQNYVFLVDPADSKFTGDKNTVINFLHSKNLIPVVILLTHGHFDHIAGLKDLKEEYSSIPIAIHKEDSAFIGKNSMNEQKKSLCIMNLEQILPSVSDLPEADILFDKNTTLEKTMLINYVPTEVKTVLSEWEILQTPGHTFGSVCYYNRYKNILISGDTLFYHSYGRTDLYGGNKNLMQESILFLKKNISANTHIFPGHDAFDFTMRENFL